MLLDLLNDLIKNPVKTLRTLFIVKSTSTLVEGFRSLIIAGIAFLCDFTLMVILTEIIDVPYLASATIGFTCGLFVNYILSVTWAFSERSHKSPFKEFLIFLLIGIIGLLLLDFTIWFLTEKCGLFYIFSKLVATAIVFFWNFFLRKIILFS